MFNIKNILVVAIALVSFFLFTLWEKEQQPLLQHTSSVTATTITQAKPVQTTTALLPNGKPVAAQLQMKPRVEHSYIQVKTDVVDVLIDRVGGKVISNQLLAYPEQVSKNSKPFTLLTSDDKHYYIAESGLVSPLGPDSATAQGLYQSEKAEYVLAKGEDTLTVPLVYQNQAGLIVTKNFVFKRGSYDIDINYVVANHSNNTWEGQSYWQLKRKKPASESSMLSFSTYTGGAYSTKEDPYNKVDFSDMAKQDLDKVSAGGWIAMVQQYFLSAFVPDKNQDNRFYTLHEGNDVYAIGAISPVYQLAPQQQMTISGKLYSGPLVTSQLKEVAPHLDMTVDYGWLWYISVILFWLLQQIHSVIGNWGWSIILLTVLIKVILYAPSNATYRSAIRMRELQPKMQALRERFANDKQGLHQHIAELYKKEKVNPLGGCLPLLMQLPVFIGLYWAIIESVELRQAPFMGWIHDLSAKDPYYVLPALMFVTMFIQQKLSPPPADPMQAKVMNFMPVVFAALFINFPAGLLLYWVVNNILSILQQWLVNKTYGGSDQSNNPSLITRAMSLIRKEP